MALIVLPSSPRWLTLRGRDSEAAAVWEKLGVSPADREKIINQHSDDSEVDSTASSEKINDKSEFNASGDTSKEQNIIDEPQITIKEAFSSPHSRRQLLFAVFLMGMQMMSGVDGVLFVSRNIVSF